MQYDPKTVACGASLVRLMYELMISGMGWDKVKQALEIEKKLVWSIYRDQKKDKKFVNSEISLFRNLVKDSVIPASTLKRESNLKRVFWAICKY